MQIEIKKDFVLQIYGFSGVVKNKNYTETCFKLSDKMWQTVKSENLKTCGKNIWMYEADEKVFAGLELLETSKNEFILEKKKFN